MQKKVVKISVKPIGGPGGPGGRKSGGVWGGRWKGLRVDGLGGGERRPRR